MHAIHRIDDIGAGLAEDDQQNGGLAVHNPAARMFWTESSTSAISRKTDRRAIVIADDQRLVIFGLEQLIVGGDVGGGVVVGDLPFGLLAFCTASMFATSWRPRP